MLVWLTLPFEDFCGFRYVAVNSMYKLQFLFYIYCSIDVSFIASFFPCRHFLVFVLVFGNWNNTAMRSSGAVQFRRASTRPIYVRPYSRSRFCRSFVAVDRRVVANDASDWRNTTSYWRLTGPIDGWAPSHSSCDRLAGLSMKDRSYKSSTRRR